MNARDIVILAGARTGMCRYGGPLRDTSALDLGAVAARGAVERSGVPAADFDHVVWLTQSERETGARLWGRSDGLVAGMAVEHVEPSPPAAWPRPYFLYAGRIEQGRQFWPRGRQFRQVGASHAISFANQLG